VNDIVEMIFWISQGTVATAYSWSRHIYWLWY